MSTSKGIYVNTTVQFNTKCVIFGVALCAGYWYLPPKKNIFMVPVIFTIAYVVMAWYDQLYNCNNRLHSGSQSWGMAVLDSIFKPQQRGIDDHPEPPPGKYFVSNQEAVYRRYVYLFHVLAIVPLFITIGYYRTTSLAQRLYLPLLGFAILGFVYHLYRSFKPRPEQSYIIYPSHLLAFLPLALYVGLKGKSSPKIAFNGLMWLGIAAGIYHSMRYFTTITEEKTAL